MQGNNIQEFKKTFYTSAIFDQKVGSSFNYNQNIGQLKSEGRKNRKKTEILQQSMKIEEPE